MAKSVNTPSEGLSVRIPAGMSREIKKVQARIHDTKDKKSLINVPYRKMISTSLAKSLSMQILEKLEKQKIYRDSAYSAKQLAIDLHTNTRYLSAVVNSFFKKSYSSLVNEYRIKDAVVLLSDKHYRDKTIEDIGLMVGFANRQSFYSAFNKYVGETPRSFRLKYIG